MINKVALVFFKILFCLLALAIAACGGKPTSVATPPAPAIVAVTGLDDTIFFPVPQPVNDEGGSDTALLVGELIFKDNCLRINDKHSDTSYLPIWPPDFTVMFDENNVIRVKNGAGETVASPGYEISTGGGELPDVFVNQQIRNACEGPYWVIGEWQGTPISLNKATEYTIFFPRPMLVEGVSEGVDEALFSGKLVVSDGCLRMNNAEYNDSYLVIWPPDFKPRRQNGVIEILDGSDQVVGRVGDEVVTGGGEVPNAMVPQDIRSTCPGPYLVVGNWHGPIEE